MTITLRFMDTDVARGNAKAARGWLRGRHLNVAQCEKQGDVWVFDFSLANPVLYDKAKPANLTKPRKVSPRRPSPPKKEIPLLQPVPVPVPPPVPRVIKHQAILGGALRSGDCLVNFVPGHDLTIDYRGILTITHKPKYNLPGADSVYQGFYSQESGSLSSYRINKEEVYDVWREDSNAPS